eukprot:TRINITY_DN6516_c0_g1_i1.p1 TRINITY_DN6516_c0_g1~~TRINITY_DN6516_c0_g1_i1.p1  ORF type:complete len:225 (-),score=24.79 TRINITY_DN6516_c0_g1_i1:40-714(-)
MTSFLIPELFTPAGEMLLQPHSPSSSLSPLIGSDTEDKNYFDFGISSPLSSNAGISQLLDQLVNNNEEWKDYFPATQNLSLNLPPHLSQLHDLVLNNSNWTPRSMRSTGSSNKMKRNHLSSWMCTQRVEKKKGELLDYRKRLLDLVGFVWSKQDKQQKRRNDEGRKEWTQEKEDQILLFIAHSHTFTGRAQKNHEQWIMRFHELVEFKRKHGHLKVPILIPSEE